VSSSQPEPSAASGAGVVPASRRRRLVMVSGSYAHNDARVLKSAATAAAAGYQVTVVAPSPTWEREDEDRSGWALANVPVVRRARDAVTRSRTLGHVGYADAARAASAREALARAEAKRGGRAAARLRLHRWVVDKRTVVMRYRQTRRIWNEPWARPVAEWALRFPAVRTWRRMAPESVDLEEAFAPVLDALQPDLLHSHDVQTLNVVAAASERAAARGRRVPWIYDAHEHIVGLTTYSPDRLAGLIDLEESFIRRADAVLTVCDPIADDLWRRFGLRERPTVVLNAPLLAAGDPDPVGSGCVEGQVPAVTRANRRSLHVDAGLDPATPIVVYSGKVDRDRGIDDLASALVDLPVDVHVVLITNRDAGDSYLAGLRGRLERHGCAGRLRIVPYVAPDELVDYLSEAAVGFAGFSPIGNHEVSLPNKFFDYLHAGVPMVVSDLRLLGPLVRRLGVGRVYPFGDARALASVITWMLRERHTFLPALLDPEVRRTYSWQAQEPALLGVYERLAPPPATVAVS
jgi:glycosyltransferase involved in cell wall biosynthesis